MRSESGPERRLERHRPSSGEYPFGADGLSVVNRYFWAVVGATGFSALVGMLFGILPARRAANLAPIDALRHE